VGHSNASGTVAGAVFPGAIRRVDARAEANVVGVDASPKHTTATSGRRAVQLVVAFVTVAPMVCATAPVSGAESTRSPTYTTRRARDADTRVLRTLTAIVTPVRTEGLR